MPVIALLDGSLTVTPREDVPLTGRIFAQSANDYVLGGEITIDEAVARTGIASERKAGVTLWLDYGFGLQPVPREELLPDITISESIATYADELTFSVYGARYSPFVSGVIRGKQQVRLELTVGPIGGLRTFRLFDGFITSASYDTTRRVATITALDSAIRYSETTISPLLEPKSGRRRLEYVQQLLAENGVPVGRLELGNGAVTEIVKPVSQGEVRLFDFLSSFLQPCGAWVYFARERFSAQRFSRIEPVVRRLVPRDVALGSTINIPATADPNRFIAVTVRFEQADPSGTVTEVEQESTFTHYAVQGGILQQATNGVQSPVNFVGSETWQEVSRIVTRTTRLGTLVVRAEQEEWAWHAPHAARSELDALDNIDPYAHAMSWQYPDGTWRREARERFRVVRSSVVTKTLDEQKRVTMVTEHKWYWRMFRQALRRVDSAGNEVAYTPNSIPITESGEGITPAQEYYGAPPLFSGTHPSEVSVTEYQLADDDTIEAITVTETGSGPGAKMGPATVGAYVFGLENKQYHRWSVDVWGEAKRVTKTTYTATSEEGYRETVTTTTAHEGTSGGPKVERVTRDVRGVRPRAERVQPESRSQELRVTVTDQVRADLSGVVEDYIQNEYCQDEADLLELARHRAREVAAWSLTVDMPLEGQIHKGDYVELDGWPLIGIRGRRCLVHDVSRRLGEYRQTIGLRYYPPEVV